MKIRILWPMVVAMMTGSTALLGQDFVWTQSNAPSNQWQFVTSSSEGTKLMAAANFPSAIYTSTNSGLTWTKSAAPAVIQWNCGASSADGTKLVAADNINGGIYTSTNTGFTWTQTGSPNRNWWSIASSFDGTKLVAGSGGSLITGSGVFTSTNSGLTWKPASTPTNGTYFVATSSDGTTLVAADHYGGIYASTNSGITWTQSTAPSKSWNDIAMSSDGSNSVAVIFGGGIFTSTNFGFTWAQTSAPNTNWFRVTSSADGTKLAAIAGFPTVNGKSTASIYFSTNSGLTWKNTSAPSTAWWSIASSADGTKLVAVSQYGDIYTATNLIPSLMVRVDGQIAAGTNIVKRGPVTITLEASFANGIIGYSLDGSEPRSSSILYTGPFTVRESALLRAVAYNSTFTDSVEMDAVQITIFPTLTVNTEGGGTVSIDPPSGPYLSNSIAQITAQPASGCAFLQWLGDASGTNPITTVAMSRDKYVEAVFGTAVGTIVVGGGSVSADPLLTLYPFGTTIRFTAQPQTGNYFAQWGASASGTNNPLNFVVSTATPSVSATFPVLGGGKYVLTVIESGNGHVTVNPYANSYTNGQTVMLAAVPDTGQNFVGWSGSATENQNPLIVTVNSNEVITASFTERPSLQVGTPLAGAVEGGFRITINGEYGADYQILNSTNLATWTVLGVVTNTFGVSQFLDANGTNTPLGFYRLMQMGQ